MKSQRSTRDMLTAIVEAHRSLHQARLRCVNCPDRIRDWCQQEAEWRRMVLDGLTDELALREDAHAIETALRFLLTQNAPDDP